jgi:hypothetical protein
MRTLETRRYAEALGCAELGRNGCVDTRECCAACHSAERYAHFALGPCRVALPDGREAYVCCSAKKRLLRGASAGPVLVDGPSRNGRA